MDTPAIDSEANTQGNSMESGVSEEMMEQDFQLSLNKRKRKKAKKSKVQGEDCSDEDSNPGDNKKVCGGDGSEAEATNGAGLMTEASTSAGDRAPTVEGVETSSPVGGANTDGRIKQSGRIRLLFPRGCQMNFDEKLQWTARLARHHTPYEALIRTGVNTAYITVGNEAAAEALTTSGFEGCVLQRPELITGEKRTKVIIFGYPKSLPIDFLLDNPKFEWAKRNIVRGEEKSQLVAMLRGEVLERVFVPGIGYKNITPYVEQPILCMKCSRWKHKAWSCQYDERCRFCARSHPSTVCANKIKEGVKVARLCCNCKGPHNANFSQCPVRLRLVQGEKRNVTPTQRYVDAPVPKENVWNTRTGEEDWPGLSEARSVSVKEKSTTQSSVNNEVLSALNELKSAFQDLAKRVEMLEKRKNANENREKEVSQREEDKAESVNVNQSDQGGKKCDVDMIEDVEYTDDVEGNNIEMSPKYILDMCREMKKMAEGLMNSVAKGENVTITRGSAPHALIRALSDAKYK